MEEDKKEGLEQAFRTYYARHRAGQFSEAEKGYKALLKQRPDWGQVLAALGNLYLDQEQPGKAVPVFERAAGLTPPDLSACYNLGRLKQLENDHEGAIPLYRAMLDLQPGAGGVWNNLGVAYRETGKSEQALASFEQAVRFAPDMAAAWNNLGVALEEQHQVAQNQTEENQAENALAAYRKAIEIQPDYASPHLNLGIALQKLRQYKRAETHYSKVLALQPDNETARFMLQSIRGDETPEAAPVDHVRRIFDQCADKFETILVEGLAYKTPERLFDLVRPYLTEEMAILDLGCGTGLGAEFYQPFASHLTGVDVSSKMLEKAAEKKRYNRLEVFNILQDWEFPEKFDLIYSSDVFVYFGNLDPIIRSAASYLTENGKLAFSVEELEDDTRSYRLDSSGRYAHSTPYIQACLSRYGLKVGKLTRADIRNQSGHPVKGLLVVGIKEGNFPEQA